MPKVAGKSGSKKERSRRKPLTVPVTRDGVEEVRVSSVLFGLALIIGLMVAGAAWMGGSLSQLEQRFGNALDGAARAAGLAVHNITVEGVDGALASDIRQAALIEPGENMFRADPYRIRKRIEASDIAATVQVHRFWPDNILIIATAAEPAAIWQGDDDVRMVDTLGQSMALVPAAAAEPSGLLTLEGSGADVALPGLLAVLADAPELRARVTGARRLAGMRWDLRLHTGAWLVLPGDAEVPAALLRVRDMHQQMALLDRPVLRIDVSDPRRTVIAPVEPQLTAFNLAQEDS